MKKEEEYPFFWYNQDDNIINKLHVPKEIYYGEYEFTPGSYTGFRYGTEIATEDLTSNIFYICPNDLIIFDTKEGLKRHVETRHSSSFDHSIPGCIPIGQVVNEMGT